MSKCRILDCTLRDGGYVNNWQFSVQQYWGLAKEMQDTKVEIMELGIMGRHTEEGFSTKFTDFQAVPKVPDNDMLYTVMYMASEIEHFQEIPQWEPGMFQGIRLAFFKDDAQAALKYIEKMRGKGYQFFLQPMATFLYTDEELAELIRQANMLAPYAFYMVDSFGTMYGEDVRRMFALVHRELAPGIKMGFHAHNNIQLAFSNVMEFVRLAYENDREAIVDASVFGMGRGAGNANLELVAGFFNRFYQRDYCIDRMVELYCDYISEEYQKNDWGYSMQYFVASQEKANAAYVWYLNRKGVTDVREIRRILRQIPKEKRHTLDRRGIDEILGA